MLVIIILIKYKILVQEQDYTLFCLPITPTDEDYAIIGREYIAAYPMWNLITSHFLFFQQRLYFFWFNFLNISISIFCLVAQSSLWEQMHVTAADTYW